MKKKESEKVNVKSFSSFGVRVNDHKRERENVIKTSHNRGGESRCLKNNINEQ